MKTAIVMPSARPHGGAEEALMQLLRCREAAGLEFPVTFLEDGPLVPLARAEGCNVKVVEAGRLREPLRLIRVIRELRRWLSDERPEVVLGWMTKAHLYSGLAALGSGIPACYFQMGLPDGGVVDRLSRWVPARGALGCSDFVARQQQAHVSHPVRGVALAADLDRFQMGGRRDSFELKQRLGFDPNRPLVGIVGRLQEWKGMHVFVSAMSRICSTHPGCQGVIVGGRFDAEPDYPEELQRQINALGMQRTLRMVGAQSNVPEWMQAMDVVVHASEREPFGIVVVEAMALGKPVVAARPGGPEEIIVDGRDGLLTQWNDEAALAEAIQRLLDDPALARRLGEAARRRSLDFGVEGYARRLGVALRSMLGMAEVTETFAAAEHSADRVAAAI